MLAALSVLIPISWLEDSQSEYMHFLSFSVAPKQSSAIALLSYSINLETLQFFHTYCQRSAAFAVTHLWHWNDLPCPLNVSSLKEPAKHLILMCSTGEGSTYLTTC
jgi:hypothetical protein